MSTPKEILERLLPPLRAEGFRGSAPTLRKHEDDFVFVVNFQASRHYQGGFFINLGAQPRFVPAEGDADLDRIKEYECVLRWRVGDRHPARLSKAKSSTLIDAMMVAQRKHFAHARTMPACFATDPTELLLQKFCAGTTEAHATLILARAGLALGHLDKAADLAHLGLELARPGATELAADLVYVLTEIEGRRMP